MDLEAPRVQHTATDPSLKETITVYSRHENKNNFRLARIHEPNQYGWPEEANVRQWASTKGPRGQTTATAAPNDPTKASTMYKKLADPYEIRVLELQPGVDDEIVRCRLVHCSVEFQDAVRFTTKVPGNRGVWHREGEKVIDYVLSMQDLTKQVWYTALSYTWGPPVFEGKIECEGQGLAITRSLETALRHFRRPDCSVFMWIDQICINQDDVKEKEQQIPLMSRIYQHAFNTVIWLGDSTPGSDLAMRLLEDLNSVLQFVDSDLDPAEFEARCLPPAESEAWREVWELFSRPWFTRVWIIQEAILSRQLFVACGHSLVSWEVVSDACVNLSQSGISHWLQQSFGQLSTTSNNTTVPHRENLFESAVELGSIKNRFESFQWRPSLFDLLVETRSAQCYDARDKIYGMLGVCNDNDRAMIRPSYADQCTAASQYLAAAVHLTKDAHRPGITFLLTSVDHEPSPDLPSWVPDWRKPRQTTSLGFHNIFSNVYHARGRVEPWQGSAPELEAFRLTGKNNEQLCLPGLVVDTLAATSEIFTSPDLSLTNPTTSNKTLLTALAFLSQHSALLLHQQQHHPNQEEDLFTPLYNTLLASKDPTSKNPLPQDDKANNYAEILSLLLDATTSNSPTLPGQPYTPRQLRPPGKGRLELSSLRNGSRGAGRTFQAVRASLKNAMRMRRLGVTSGGRLGLFPAHGAVGDRVLVVGCCHVPVLGREVALSMGDGGGGGGGGGGGERFRVMGECFVYGIMDGEAVSGDGVRMEEITLV